MTTCPICKTPCPGCALYHPLRDRENVPYTDHWQRFVDILGYELFQQPWGKSFEPNEFTSFLFAKKMIHQGDWETIKDCTDIRQRQIVRFFKFKYCRIREKDPRHFYIWEGSNGGPSIWGGGGGLLRQNFAVFSIFFITKSLLSPIPPLFFFALWGRKIYHRGSKRPDTDRKWYMYYVFL